MALATDKQLEGKQLTLKWILTLYSTPSFNTKVSFLSASRSPARRESSHQLEMSEQGETRHRGEDGDGAAAKGEHPFKG